MDVNFLVCRAITESIRELSKEEINKLLTPECSGTGDNVVCKDLGYDEKADKLLHLGKFSGLKNEKKYK